MMTKETREQRFKRVRDNRLRNFKNLMRLFSNLSNKNAYSYTDSDIDNLINDMRGEVDKLEARLKGQNYFKLN